MSKTKITTVIFGVLLVVSLVAPVRYVHAQWNSILQSISSQTTAGQTHVDSAGALVGVVQTYVFGIVLTITFITMILTGIKFGLAQGDIKAYMEARRALLYSIIAFVLAMGAFFFRRTLLNALGAPDLGPTRNIR